MLSMLTIFFVGTLTQGRVLIFGEDTLTFTNFLLFSTDCIVTIAFSRDVTTAVSIAVPPSNPSTKSLPSVSVLNSIIPILAPPENSITALESLVSARTFDVFLMTRSRTVFILSGRASDVGVVGFDFVGVGGTEPPKVTP